MSLLQKTIVIAAVVLLAGVGAYEARQTARRQGQFDTLQRKQSPLLHQLAALKVENERLSNQVARIRNAQALSPTEVSELLQQRGRHTVAQADARELRQLKGALADQDGKLPEYLMTQLAMTMRFSIQRDKRGALDKLARMKEALHFDEAQLLTVSNNMMLRIEREHQLEFDMLAHSATTNRLAQAAGLIDQQETEFQALLSPEQRVLYAEYLQQEKTANAEGSARSEAGRLAEDFKLTAEQQDKIRARLYELNLKTPTDPKKLRATLQVATSSQPAEALRTAAERMESQLEEKLKVLGEVLTPEQLQSYRDDRLQDLNADVVMMRVFLPQPAH